MARSALFIVVCLIAALAPVFVGREAPSSKQGAFPGWPTQFEGRALVEIPLSERERRFAEGFPGRIGRFDDGSREIIIRWVAEETRMLHPAADCFKGIGYTVVPKPLFVDDSATSWGSFEASRGDERLLVTERIVDETGQSWTDVSAWYWAALLGRSHGPWWSFTVTRSAS